MPFERLVKRPRGVAADANDLERKTLARIRAAKRREESDMVLPGHAKLAQLPDLIDLSFHDQLRVTKRGESVATEQRCKQY